MRLVSPRILTVCVLLLDALAAQTGPDFVWPDPSAKVLREPPATAGAAKCTVWLGYPRRRGAFGDHVSWLRDLQARNRERGLRVYVVLPPQDAEAVAAADPGIGVASIGASVIPQGLELTWSLVADSKTYTSFEFDLLADGVAAALDGNFARTAPGEADAELASALGNVGDSGEIDDLVAHALECLPRSGRARALAVLHQWWCKGDYPAAMRAFDEGLKVLGDGGPALVQFADLVLRGDSIEPSIPRSLAVALAPAAAAAPDGPFTQMVYLRALLRAGQDRPAARVVSHLETLVGDDPVARLWFSEVLMEAADPKPWRALATSLVPPAPSTTATQSVPVDERMRAAALHKILVRCGAEANEIAEVFSSYRLGGGFGGSLNNDAWYMCTDVTTMGRFPSFALAHADEMARIDGDKIDPGSKDTVALVAFCNGQIERAITLQREALAGSGGDTRYEARLRRFEAALARREARKTRKPETAR